jgi:hypothetical protein
MFLTKVDPSITTGPEFKEEVWFGGYFKDHGVLSGRAGLR